MREISLNILDIVQNSITANASLVNIDIIANTKKNELAVTITDNGKGIDKDFLKEITNPFTTTRTTRKVGLGLPLFKQAAIITGGSFDINSQQGKGTVVKAVFIISSIDRMPLGNLADTIIILVQNDNDVEIVLYLNVDGREFNFDTEKIKKETGLENFKDNEVIVFLREYLKENIEITKGGAKL